MSERIIRNTIPKVSVLIPTWNGQETIDEVLSALSIQTLSGEEIIVADSSSEDNTVKIAERHGVKIISVKPGRFDHGGTRTALCLEAKGDFLVFLTQDAIVKRRDSLEKLVAPLLKNENVASSYGRQRPAFNADHFAKSLRLFNYPEVSEQFSYKDKDTVGLRTVFTSNSFSCYRKNALEKIGFFQDGLIFGEDTVAVGRLLQEGWQHVYVAEAEVYHSHNYTPFEELKRYFDIGVFHARQKWLLETYGTAEGRAGKYLQHEFRQILQRKKVALFPELLFRVGMKYAGYHLGRRHSVLPAAAVRKLSQNSTWWSKLHE